MKLEARFVTSAAALGGCPRWDTPEIAFTGRSNAGKSSLINALVGIEGMARTSKTPGRTRLLNFFTLGDQLALVDLPGYGYARMPEAEARKVAAMTSEYLNRRINLIAMVMVIDARRGPEREEFALAEAMLSRGRKLLIAATKSDKLKRSERAAALARIAALSGEAILCSALDREGLDDIRRRLLEWSRDKAPRRGAVAMTKRS
ncbi:MAG: ribosome biogenesis GTP-binding protein YihA/YsxC [Candidatus Binataceae bacterium]|jgi:GTP-binding protein